MFILVSHNLHALFYKNGGYPSELPRYINGQAFMSRMLISLFAVLIQSAQCLCFENF